MLLILIISYYRSLLAHEDSVTCVRFQPYTHYFFSSSKDGSVKYWDADHFTCVLLLAGHKGSVWSLSISTEGAILVSGGHDRKRRSCVCRGRKASFYVYFEFCVSSYHNLM